MLNMKIGIDLDDTICCTEETIDAYSKIYCDKKSINQSVLWKNEELKKDFLQKYLKKIYMDTPLKEDVATTIKKLKKMGYQIYVISARTNNYIDCDMIKFIKNYLKNHSILVDFIIINAGDKVTACKENNINYMIDDSIYNCEKLQQAKINAILFDDDYHYLRYKNRIDSWNNLIQLLIDFK